MTDNNVVHLYPDLVPDHDEDGDGFSDSAEMVVYDPPLPTSILDTGIVVARDARADWWDRNRGALEYRCYAACFHGIRLPLYALRYTTHASKGAWRVTARVWHWTHDTEGLILRTQASTDPNLDARAKIDANAKAHDERVKKVRWRRIFTAVTVVFLTLAVRWGIHAHPWWSLLAGFLTAVCLGMVGATRHEVIPYIADPTPQTISIDAVIRAFYKAKIAKDEFDPVRVIGVPHKDGPGTVIRVELPEGITYDDVLKSRDRLASGLHCPKQCLDTDDLPDEPEALLELFIADLPPSKVAPPQWPLLLVDRWDIFQPLPVGVTPKGKPVCLSLLWVHTLIGAAPRRGKSTIMRMIALATLLDPRAKLIVVDFGGGLDYRAFEPYCHRFIHGPEAEQIEAFLDLLDTLDAEYKRRQRILSTLPVSDAPEARLTPALAERPEFAPIVVVVDEFQIATLAKKVGEVAKMGEEIVLRWAELEKVCAKVGITIFAATQTADDSVPTELRNVALQRVALSMASFQASMAILGNTAQRLGYDASTLGGLPGLGYSWGTDDGQVDGYKGKVRFANVTPADAAALLQRVARVRTKVTVAVDDIPKQREPETPQIVADVLRVWPAGEVVAHLHDLAEALGRTRSEVSGPLRKLGLAPNQNLKIRGVNRSGYDLIDVQKLAPNDPP